MTRHRPLVGSRHCQGFSLIELMVSLVIGLLISAAAFSAYLGVSGAAKMAEAQARMNEDAQAALTVLSLQLRMAGNNPKQTNRLDNTDPTLSSLRNPVYGLLPKIATILPGTFHLSAFAIQGCAGKFTDITSATSIDNLTCAGGTSTAPNSIAISYEADKFNTVPTTAGLPTDCLGNGLSPVTATFVTIPPTVGNLPYYVADNRFYIGTSAAILSPSLYCKGSGGATTAQPLVENIEDLQFSYGAVSTTTQLAGYLTADQVTALVTGNPAAGWAKVVTVRICVLVRSESPVISDANSAKYLNCAGALVAPDPPDLRLRRAYSTTVVLRNRRP